MGEPETIQKPSDADLDLAAEILAKAVDYIHNADPSGKVFALAAYFLDQTIKVLDQIKAN